MQYVMRLDAMSKEQYRETGGKAANLGELIRHGFNVPGGFCVIGKSLDYLLERNALESGIMEIARQIDGLKSPIGEDPFVAVRSSVAVKDSTISSFPGMMDTYHFIKGEDEIIENIRRCRASLYTSRAVYRRHQQDIPQNKGVIAPIVQDKNIMITIDREKGIGRKKYELSGWMVTDCTMTDEQLVELAEIGERIEELFGYPQDIEWA